MGKLPTVTKNQNWREQANVFNIGQNSIHNRDYIIDVANSTG